MPPITVNARGANHLSDVALILQRRIVVGTVIECGAFFCENAADQDEIVAESVGDKVERVEWRSSKYMRCTSSRPAPYTIRPILPQIDAMLHMPHGWSVE